MKFYDSVTGKTFDIDISMAQGVIYEVNNSYPGMNLGQLYARINEMAEKAGLPQLIPYESYWPLNEFKILDVNAVHTNSNGEPIIILDFNLERA